MLRHFIWSEGMGMGQPWISVVNVSPDVMTAVYRLRLDNLGSVITWTESVMPWERTSIHLKKKVRNNHFWLCVTLNRMGGATLTNWSDAYALPPYTPPPTIIVEDGEAQQLRIKTTIEPK